MRSFPMRATALFLSLAWPGFAAALDLDYYTYNAFDETVMAFQRLALIFSNTGFMVFIGIFAVLGTVIGGVVTGYKGVSGQQVNPVGWLFPIAAGIVIFRGLVIPTGTVHVYDDVRNAYQAVGDVPDLVVLLAGGLNKMERGIVDILDTASATPYADEAGALSYSLVLGATSTTMQSVNLERTLSRYYTDCGLPSMALGYNGTSAQMIKRGSVDLYADFALFSHPSLFTVWWPDGNDGGVTGTCAESWNYIDSQLNGNYANVVRTYREATCAKAGFNAAVATEMARCDSLMQSASSLFGTTPADAVPFVRSMLVAKSISDALNTDDFSISNRRMTDRQIMAEGFGASEAFNSWVPKLRGYMLSMTLGVIPLCFVLLVTPLFWKSAAFAIGLFVWLATWGIMDALAAQQTADAARAAFEEIQRYGLSYDAIMQAPQAAVQALGLFMKARTHAMQLSTVFCGAVLLFGGSYAFSSMSNGWQHHLEQAGERAGRQVILPEERGAFQQSLQTSLNAQAALAAAGGSLSTAQFANAKHGMQSASQAAGYIDASRISGGASPFHDVWSQGQMAAGGELGAVRAREGAAATTSDSILTSSLNIGTFTQQEHDFGAVGRQAPLGTRTPEMLRFNGYLQGQAINVSSEVAGNLTKRGSLDVTAAGEVARMQHASELGLSENLSADRAVGMFGAQHRESYGRISELSAHVDPMKAGRVHGMKSAAEAEGTLSAMERGTATYEGMETGERVGLEDRVIEGQTRDQAGVAARTQLAQTGLATGVASSTLTRSMAQFLQLPENLWGYVRTQTAQQSAHQMVSIDTSSRPELSEHLLDSLEERNLLPAGARETLKDQPGFSVNLTMGADGQPVAGAIQAGSSVMILNETQLRTGFNQRTDDSRSYAGGLRMESSAAAFTDQQMGEILVDAIGDDLAHGSIREQDRQALADSHAQYLAASGVTAGVSNSENVQYQGGVNGTLGLSEAGSGFGIGGSVVKSKTDGRDVRIDLDRKQLNAFIDEALEQTRGDYGDARLVFTNHYEFGARWNQHIREKVEDYRDTNLNISKDAVEGHNAVEEPSTPPAPRPITQYRW